MESNAVCRDCGKKLSDSFYLLKGNILLKSCPRCSQQKGQHVFYPCPQKYGYRMMDGVQRIQSQCIRCRSKAEPLHEGHVLCTDAISEGYHELNSIRILPVSDEGFGSARDFDTFFTELLPSRGYRYYFGKGMNDAKGALALLQYKAHIRGFVLIKDEIRTPAGYDLDSKHYNGYYELYPDTLTLFEEPLSLEMYRAIDPTIQSFNQSIAKPDQRIIPTIVSNGISAGGVRDDAPMFEEYSEDEAEKLHEGAVKKVYVDAYERNPVARRRCIEHYRKMDGAVRCQICGFEFGKTYGPDFDGMIHVHHLTEISETKGEHEVDPISDLIPICPNCHAVVHKRKPPYAPDEVRLMLKKEV